MPDAPSEPNGKSLSSTFNKASEGKEPPKVEPRRKLADLFPDRPGLSKEVPPLTPVFNKAADPKPVEKQSTTTTREPVIAKPNLTLPLRPSPSVEKASHEAVDSFNRKKAGFDKRTPEPEPTKKTPKLKRDFDNANDWER